MSRRVAGTGNMSLPSTRVGVSAIVPPVSASAVA
jgi:hypothetical protein